MKLIMALFMAAMAVTALSYGDVVMKGSPATEYAPLSGNALNNYYGQLDAQIQKAEKRVKDLEANVASQAISPTWSSKLEMQNAIIQLEVKKTLVGNFKGTESMRSALVRQRLLDVLSKPSISTGDLAELQSLVLDEKAKIRSFDATTSASPGPQ
jgi:hypothetical protein